MTEPAPSDPDGSSQTSLPQSGRMSQEDRSEHADADVTPTLLEQMGGVSGLVASSIPVLVFVPVNSMAGLGSAIWAAVGTAVAVTIWRLARREAVQPAISGLFGVAIAALIAHRTGDAKGFFLLGIWSSLVYAGVFTVSLVVRRPLVGVIWHAVNGDTQDWRHNPRLRRAYEIATLTWTGVFIARFLVQKWLYDQDSTTGLGVAKIAMGYPLTALAIFVTIWAVRRANRVPEPV